MVWFLYALLAAFCLSTTDALCKKALKETDELVVAWVRFGFALPFLLDFGDDRPDLCYLKIFPAISCGRGGGNG